VVFLILGLLVPLRTPAQNLQPMIQFDMFVGFSGVQPAASWSPITFEIRNDGMPFTGIIELIQEPFDSGVRRSMAVELPTGTTKRVTLPVFFTGNFSVQWSARLLDEKGSLRATANTPAGVNAQPLNWRTHLMLALPRDPRGTPSFRKITLSGPGGLQPVCARMQTALFPDNPLVLERVNSIYLNSERAIELKDNQVRALQAWLHAGGHLIVGVEQAPDVNALPWLRALAPLTPNGPVTLSRHSALHNWALTPAATADDVLFNARRAPNVRNTRERSASSPGTGSDEDKDRPSQALDAPFEAAPLNVISGELLPGTKTILSADGTPLAVSAARGRGTVTFLLFSPEREPMRSWKYLSEFWTRLAGVPEVLFTDKDSNFFWEQSSDGVFGAMVDSRQVRKLPVGWLLLLLAVYLAVIGPVDRWWLRKINRPMLTWITFPSYVLAFSVGIYVLGYKLRAGETEWNEVHVVDVLKAGDKAELRGRTYASLYSPANDRYSMAGNARIAALRPEAQGVQGRVGGGDECQLFQTGDSFKAEVFVPVWVSRLVVNDWWQGAPVPLEMTVSEQNGRLTCRVRNALSRPLKSLWLVHGKRVHPLSAIPAGTITNITLNVNDGMDLESFMPGGNLSGIAQQRQHAFGGSESGRINDIPSALVRSSFLSLTDGQNGNARFFSPPGLDLWPLLFREQAVLLAWDPGNAPVKPVNQFTTRRERRDTFWRVAASVDKTSRPQ
jgi:hypothetical protein